MLERLANNYSKYLGYAYSICQCNETKKDLVQELFIKVDSLLSKDPSKEISDGFCYLTMRSIYIDGLRKHKTVCLEEIYLEPEIYDDTLLNERMEAFDILENLMYFDREILMIAHRKGIRPAARAIGCSPAYILKCKKQAEEKVKILWEDLKVA